MGSDADRMLKQLTGITSQYTRQRKAEERTPGARRHRFARLTMERDTFVKEAAWECMEEAYMAASTNNTLPANARQVMYQARPKIQQMTDRPLSDVYFTQILLPDYVAENGCNWDVVYDSRGHFSEPHTRNVIGLGTLDVRKYLNHLCQPNLKEAKLKRPWVYTWGPKMAYSGMLFIEKEGFDPLFKHAKIAEKYDIGIISTKGMPTVAARKLIDDICGGLDIPLFTLHDFDLAGLTINSTLSGDTRRYAFRNPIEVIDLGLRLKDCADLEAEDAAASKSSDEVLIRRALRDGATQEEAEFLVSQRVELNAMTSGNLIKLIEDGLKEYGIKKIVPDITMLNKAYQMYEQGRQIHEQVKELTKVDLDSIKIPDDLQEQFNELIAEHPTMRWDRIVEGIVDPETLELDSEVNDDGDYYIEDEEDEDEDSESDED